MLKAGFGTPFAEQLEFFRQKLNLPSARWDDIWQEAHDRAFIVAGAMKADLLNDLRQAVDKAIAQGRGLEDFRRDFRKIVKAHGWTGWTGEGSKGGEAWRTRVIWETNMTTSYAAGRWQQLTDPEFLKRRPYWRYVHADYVANPRVQHLAWDGLTLPHDHPFWRTHFPPNGWGCQCRITPVNAREYEKSRAAGKAEAPEGWEEATGIDKGFAYAPGESLASVRKAVLDKAKSMPEPLGDALKAALDETEKK